MKLPDIHFLELCLLSRPPNAQSPDSVGVIHRTAFQPLKIWNVALHILQVGNPWFNRALSVLQDYWNAT